MPGENVVKLKVDDRVYTVDFDDLEIDEIGTIEDLTGKSVQDIDWYSARGMQGLLWIAMHRSDPRVSLQDVGKVKFSAIKDADDTPADESKPKRPTKAAPAGKSGAAS